MKESPERHEIELTESVDPEDGDFVGDATQMGGHAAGGCRSNAVTHLGAIAIDSDLTIGRDFDGSQRSIASGAVVLGRTGDAGADENSRLLSTRPLLARCVQIGCFSSLSRISGARIDDDVGISRQIAVARIERIAATEFNRIERQLPRQISSTCTSSAVMVCSVP